MLGKRDNHTLVRGSEPKPVITELHDMTVGFKRRI
jgi:hypothetical protein